VKMNIACISAKLGNLSSSPVVRSQNEASFSCCGGGRPVGDGCLEAVMQGESHLERFGGVEDVSKLRVGGWRDAGDIGVGDVVGLRFRRFNASAVTPHLLLN